MMLPFASTPVIVPVIVAPVEVRPFTTVPTSRDGAVAPVPAGPGSGVIVPFGPGVPIGAPPLSVEPVRASNA